MSLSPAVEVERLVKVYRDPVVGEHRAVDGVSFTCRPGRVFGLLGPNAAGKTTTLRILATLLAPTSGTARVAGCDLVTDPAGVRARIGFVTASTGVYERMTPREILSFFGRVFSMERDHLAARIDELLEVFDLGRDADRLAGTLSSGTRQKVNVARAVIHDPPVLILDEPTANLDCLVARTVLDFIARESRERGRTVLLSGHRMEEVERLCDDVLVLHAGRILAAGTAAEVRAEWSAASLEEVFFKALGRVQAIS